MSSKICITGVAGFIGSNLASELLRRGYEVVGIDNLSQGDERNLEGVRLHARFRFHQLDIRDIGAIRPVLEGADAIFHLAAFKIPRYGDALETLRTNVHGTGNVLKCAIRGKSRVIFTSTSDVYGRNPAVPFSEWSDCVMGPSNVRRWSYAISKLFDEHLALGYHREHGVPVVGVRLFGGYGPHQNLTWWGGPQSVFIGAALRGEPMEIHGDGLQTRSFTFVSDHVDGLVRCLETRNASGEIFNLGNNREITIKGLAEMIWRMARKDEPQLKFIPYQTFGKYEDVMRRIPELEKPRTVLGFEPKVALEQGMPLTIEWQKRRMQA